MKQTVGDFVVSRLHAWGVRMFGYPGGRINGVFGALNRAGGKIEFIQVRHEEMAAFTASAYAKFSGELGVCIATSGPGAAHLVTGMYDARADHQPLLAIVVQQARGALGGHYQQEVDLAALFKDVAGDFVHQASTPAQVRHLIDSAVRIALSNQTVTALILPNDLQELPYEEPERVHGTVRSNNEDLYQVTWERRVMEGDPKFKASQSIRNLPNHRFAELIGLKSVFIDRAEDLGPAWDDALASDRPVLLEVKTDPEVPTMPPHLTFEQVKILTATLMKGDPNQEGVIRGTVRQVLSSVLPGKHE